jgi:hypothetical protein
MGCRPTSASRALFEYRLALTLLCLVMGAAANVAVAWWVAAGDHPPWLNLVEVASAGDAPAPVTIAPGGATWPWSDGRPENAIAYDPIEFSAGWPLESMACEFPNRRRLTEGALALGGLSLPPLRHGEAMVPRALPLRPIWPGFALNTCLYAAALALPVLCVTMARPLRAPWPVHEPARGPTPVVLPPPGGQGILSARPVVARPPLPWYGR